MLHPAQHLYSFGWQVYLYDGQYRAYEYVGSQQLTSVTFPGRF